LGPLSLLLFLWRSGAGCQKRKEEGGWTKRKGGKEGALLVLPSRRFLNDPLACFKPGREKRGRAPATFQARLRRARRKKEKKKNEEKQRVVTVVFPSRRCFAKGSGVKWEGEKEKRREGGESRRLGNSHRAIASRGPARCPGWDSGGGRGVMKEEEKACFSSRNDLPCFILLRAVWRPKRERGKKKKKSRRGGEGGRGGDRSGEHFASSFLRILVLVRGTVAFGVRG